MRAVYHIVEHHARKVTEYDVIGVRAFFQTVERVEQRMVSEVLEARRQRAYVYQKIGLDDYLARHNLIVHHARVKQIELHAFA